jgi:hypothetical protein
MIGLRSAPHDQSKDNYTGYASHAVMLPTMQQLGQLKAEIERLSAASSDSPDGDDDGSSL